MSFQLPHIISWSHRFCQETLVPGDLAVDLTAGRGRDTLMLWRAVAANGRVLAFDIQEEALSDTRCLLEEEGAPCFRVEKCRADRQRAGVYLVHDDHARMAAYLAERPRVVIANLGYLPGGDPSTTTLPETTRTALANALESLLPGGRLVCVVYVAHPGGADEARQVEDLLGALSSRDWFVVRMQVANRHEAPYLLVAERRQGG